MESSLRIFINFLWRDYYVQARHIGTFLINNVLLYPIIQSVTFLYLIPSIVFGGQNATLNTTMFIGNMLLLMLILTWKLAMPLLFDLDQDRFIDYQISILSPSLVLLERILFSSLFTWVLLLPIFPLVSIYFPAYFDTSTTSWWRVIVILYCGSLFCAAYHTFMACALPSPRDIRRLWVRYNQVLFLLGGFSIPWHIVNQTSPILGYITRLNPMMYISEGLRQAFLNDARFFPFWLCTGILLIASTGMTLLAWRAFKRRVDHV